MTQKSVQEQLDNIKRETKVFNRIKVTINITIGFIIAAILITAITVMAKLNG